MGTPDAHLVAAAAAGVELLGVAASAKGLAVVSVVGMVCKRLFALGARKAPRVEIALDEVGPKEIDRVNGQRARRARGNACGMAEKATRAR